LIWSWIQEQNTVFILPHFLIKRFPEVFVAHILPLSVDKPEESSNGRMSVTGLLTEAGTLMSSYTYDPYGNLSSGIPNAINYYEYNAGSMNTNT